MGKTWVDKTQKCRWEINRVYKRKVFLKKYNYFHKVCVDDVFIKDYWTYKHHVKYWNKNKAYPPNYISWRSMYKEYSSEKLWDYSYSYSDVWHNEIRDSFQEKYEMKCHLGLINDGID